MKKLFDRSGLASIIFMSIIGCFLALAIDYYLVSNTFSVSEDVAGSYTPGTYTATEDGFEGPVDGNTTVNLDGGTDPPPSN